MITINNHIFIREATTNKDGVRTQIITNTSVEQSTKYGLILTIFYKAYKEGFYKITTKAIYKANTLNDIKKHIDDNITNNTEMNLNLDGMIVLT